MRLFVAVNLPDDVRRGIWTAAERLRRADLPVRWVEPDGIHLTLKFLGEVEQSRREEIEAGLAAAVRGARPFQMPMADFGAFPSVERPRVIWVGCEGVPPLELLQHHLEREMERLGFAVEGRPFRPHLTLGRARKDGRPAQFRRLGPLLAGLSYDGETLVRSVELMESRLGSNGAQYRPLRSIPFDE
jgi:2'-5' RNA ligase